MLIGERKRDREDSFEKHVSSTSRLSGAQVQKNSDLKDTNRGVALTPVQQVLEDLSI